jgi:organic hydroperoxide reductase OsmC/OhrA
VHVIAARIEWSRGNDLFEDGTYSRKHVWKFDGGTEVPASSSPQIVPVPYSDIESVDPEEAFVAALSSCHMLWFLSIAAREGYVVNGYVDHAKGQMTQGPNGKLWISLVTLMPNIVWAAERAPPGGKTEEMHRRAHQECFIANSVKTEVRVVSRSDDGNRGE